MELVRGSVVAALLLALLAGCSGAQVTGSEAALPAAQQPTTTPGTTAPEGETATPVSPPGIATLRWIPPTQNDDGSALGNLAGYRIYHGLRSDSLTQLAQLANPGLTSYVQENLVAGTHYFAVAAYSSLGQESPRSNTAYKLVR